MYLFFRIALTKLLALLTATFRPLLSLDFVQHVLLVDKVTAALHQLEKLADVGIPLGKDLLETGGNQDTG